MPVTTMVDWEASRKEAIERARQKNLAEQAARKPTPKKRRESFPWMTPELVRRFDAGEDLESLAEEFYLSKGHVSAQIKRWKALEIVDGLVSETVRDLRDS